MSVDDSTSLDEGLDVCACARQADWSEIPRIHYWHAFRRRWRLIFAIGALLVVAAVPPLHVWQTPLYTASALLRVASGDQPLAFESRSPSGESSFETARATYKELIKSRPVLSAAVNDCSVAALPVVKEQSDPIGWLSGKITVTIVDRSSELMRVELKTGDPEHSRILADAVAGAFLRWCTETQRTRRRMQIDELRQAYAEKQAELTRQQTEYAKLVEAAGGVDAETLARREKLAVQRLADLQQDTTRLKSELQRSESDWQTQQNLRLDSAESGNFDNDLTDLGKNDPLASKLLLELEEMERYAVKIRAIAAPQAVERFERYGPTGDLAAIREHYLARLAELKRRKEAALTADIERLRSQIDHSESEASLIEREIERQNTDAEKQRTSLVEIKVLKADIGRTDEVLGRLTQKIKEVEVEQGSGCPVSLIQPAETPLAPSNRSATRVFEAAAAVLCFLLPAACIVWWDITRRLISEPRDLSSNLGLSVLATFPAGVKRRFDRLHRSRGSRAVRRKIFDATESLQMAIFFDRQTRSRVLLVCGAENNEGVSSVARELAASLAAGGNRTVLVDASLRQPRLHDRFETSSHCGVSDVLCERAEIWDALHETRIENLWFAPAGRWNRQVHAAMSRGNAALLVDTLRATFQYVIIAGGPVLHGSETRFFGRCADAVLFTAQRDITRVEPAADAVEKLQSLRVNLVGAAVVT